MDFSHSLRNLPFLPKKEKRITVPVCTWLPEMERRPPLYAAACLHAKSLHACLTLEPVDCSLLGSSFHGILQARILEWVVVPSSRGSSPPRDQTCVSHISCIGRRVLYHSLHLGSSCGAVYQACMLWTPHSWLKLSTHRLSL